MADYKHLIIPRNWNQYINRDDWRDLLTKFVEEEVKFTVEVGETSQADCTSPPQVSNSGTNRNAVLDFIIPRGDGIASMEESEIPAAADEGTGAADPHDNGGKAIRLHWDSGKSSQFAVQHGRDGVGIQSIEQTATSDADGATNEWTITLTDGRQTVISVKNGETGPQGIQGERGEQGIQGERGIGGNGGFTYVVNSNESLLYWLSNGQAGQGDSDDFTSVLITAGNWSCVLSNAPQAADTKKIVGSPGYVCTIEVTATGDSLTFFEGILTGQDLEFILVAKESWAGSVYGFRDCCDMVRCSVLVVAPQSQQAVGFYRCTALDRCGASCSSKAAAFGFSECTLMSRCSGKLRSLLTYRWLMTSLLHVYVTRRQENPATATDALTVSSTTNTFCDGTCFADNGKAPVHTVADTPEGGFNQT